MHPGPKALVFAEEHGEENFGCHFPWTAYFDNTVSATLRNAIGMGLSNLRQTIYAIVVTMLPVFWRYIPEFEEGLL